MANSDSRSLKELRNDLKNADMDLFDRFMRHAVTVPKERIEQAENHRAKRGKRGPVGNKH